MALNFDSFNEYVEIKLAQIALWAEEQGYTTNTRSLPCGSYGGHIQLFEKTEIGGLKHTLSIFWYAKTNKYILSSGSWNNIEMPGLERGIKLLLPQ